MLAANDVYAVWRIKEGNIEGNAAQVAVRRNPKGTWYLEFTREDLGDPSSGVNCKRAYYGRGALFHLTFDPKTATLGGTVDVARPDQGAPYKCAEAQLLPRQG